MSVVLSLKQLSFSDRPPPHALLVPGGKLVCSAEGLPETMIAYWQPFGDSRQRVIRSATIITATLYVFEDGTYTCVIKDGAVEVSARSKVFIFRCKFLRI